MSFEKPLTEFDSFIDRFSKKTIYNYYLGVSRTLFALGTFLTLVFVDEKVMFKSGLRPHWNNQIVPINPYNIFEIVPDAYTTLTKWIICGVLLIIASGWRPRITCIIHWYISACFLNAALDIEGGDQITSNATLLLIPILLLDNRKWHWQIPALPRADTRTKVKNIISNSIFYLLKLQVCIIYFHSAIGKLNVGQWINGTAPYYWFNHPVFGMNNWLKPILNPILTNGYAAFIISWSIIIFELLMASSIFIQKKYYKKLFLVAIFFHFFIIIIHGLVSFFFAMAGLLSIYLLIEYFEFKRQQDE